MRFKNFEVIPVRDSVRLYQLVKYDDDDHYIVLAYIEWHNDVVQSYWQFRSCGLNFLEEYEEGLCEYVKKCIELLDFIKSSTQVQDKTVQSK